MKRRASVSQRVAAFLHAQGRCANPDCRRPLLPGWHADHVHPYSKGGQTDAVNLAALCPTCNQKKGAKSDGEKT